MRNINVGLAGMSSLIAQATTALTLKEWFESDDDRTYVVAFAEYCDYMQSTNREGYSSAPFSRTYKLLQQLSAGKPIDALANIDSINESYVLMMRDIGMLLIKEASLYARGESDWRPFNIKISLPNVLINALGIKDIADVKACEDETVSFVNYTPALDFNSVETSKELLAFVVNREDFSMRDVFKTKGTAYESLVINGVAYLTLATMGVKGRI